MRWTPEQKERLLAIREQHPDSFATVAQALNAWYDTDEFTKDGCQKQYAQLTPKIHLSTLPQPDPMPYFHTYFTDYGDLISAVDKDAWRDELDELALAGERVKLLHISDLHVPLHNAQLLGDVLVQHSDADAVIVAGDALEVYAYSRFRKRKAITIQEEIEAWMRIQELLSTQFKRVIIIDSNHLDRINRALESVPVDLGFLVETNLMAYLAQPFANVHVLPDWWVSIGDAIFAHADFSGGRAPKSAERVYQKLQNFMRVGQLPRQEIRLVVQAHTHHVGTSYESGVKLLESGCLAKLPLEYTVDQRSVGSVHPQQNGYVVVVQRDGRTLLNESREYLLGEESYGSGYAS